RAAAGQNAGNIINQRLAPPEGLAWQVIREGIGLVIPAVSKESRFSQADRFAGIEIRSLAIAPIQSQGKVIGVLEAINPVAKAFDPDALLVMSGLGSLAGTTIQNAQLFERLQQAHQRYRELFEDSIDPILITDWQGKILEANRQAVSLSGYERETLHTLTIDHLHEINKEKTGPAFQTLKEGQGCVYESTLHARDGRLIPVQVYARRVDFEESTSIQWIMRDITERKDLDALRDDMTAMIYHDLRSPLANIISSLEMLSALLPQTDDVKTMLTIANNSAARIQRLVNSLLDINRLEAGQPIADQRWVNPLHLIEEALQDVTPGAAGRRQNVVSNLPASLPEVWIDEDMIRRVLINLLENAIKFTPAEGRIEIGARTDTDWIEIWVSDNGPGIPASEHERIFDKFTRLRGKDKPGGLGVGLAFCRLAVRGHGGRIWVESEPEKGATFRFTLPVKAVK
ncbi:MAG: ATP-binding protein, partial [Anaerolineae bacterium]